MTTVFGIHSYFWAADSRWSFSNETHFTDEFDTRKAIEFNGEIVLYAGNEQAIILDQASVMGLVDENQYLEYIASLSNADVSFERLIVSAADGGVVDFADAHIYDKKLGRDNIYYLGSGGVYASHFFYYTHRKRKLSGLGCNLEGALRYASVKDKFTGGKKNVDIWQLGSFNVRKMNNLLDEFDVVSYTSYLNNRIAKDFHTLEICDMQKLASNKQGASNSQANAGAFSSAEGGMRKLTVSSAVARLQRAAERKAAQKS